MRQSIEIMDIFRRWNRADGINFLTIQSYQVAALMLSVALHIGLGLAVGNGYGVNGIGKPSRGMQSQILTVQLEQSDSVPVSASVENSLPPAHDEQNNPGRQTHDAPNKAAQLARHSEKEQTIFPILEVDQPYYFRSEQLSVRPVVLRDVALPDNNPLLAPLKTQKAILRIMISELGDIDEVVIEESQLPEAAAEILKDTFAKIKFQPGMIGAIPVRSQMTIEVMLENSL